jgi:hypothetical protein
MSRYLTPWRACVLVGALLIATPHVALAQSPSQPEDPPAPLTTDNRACEGCPKRSVGKALFQTTVINVFYELANLARGQATAKITPKTWWANMKQGWVWDLDDFTVNQVGHPYQGNNYFNAARANGLNFYEAAAVTAFGSATWEYFGETNHASLNDFINTTLGGIALGEMFHRASWLMRDTHASGKGRLWSEIGATVLDPVGGVNRFISGDASRVSEKPEDLVPSTLNTAVSLGAIWRGNSDGKFVSGASPFLEWDGIYGDPLHGRSRTPYDAFGVRLRFGGGATFSEARVRGRLYGQPLGHEKVQFAVAQTYDYQNNDLYQTGSQSFDANFGFTFGQPESVRTSVLAWGGLMILGAVDSLPVDLEEKPKEEEGGGPQGVSEGPRFYDYGPGSNYGVTALFTHNRWTFGQFFYEGRQLYSLDGVRANHFLQRGRLDMRVPLYKSLGFGGTAEYFDRRTYYQDEARTTRKAHFPQLRAYLTWSAR